MRTATLQDRLVLVTDGNCTLGAIDVETASGGRFAASPQAVFDRWDEFREWAAASAPQHRPVAFRPEELGAPVPEPRQIFAIGLNYRDHAAESGLDAPGTFPPVFTKFRTALAGPHTTVRLPKGDVDWEVELVVVIGRRAERVSAEDAWSHVAGLTVGQDISERVSQLAGPAPQFSLGKSFPGFAPIGPWLVTPDEIDDLDDIEVTCSLNGEEVQKASTKDLIFSVPRLVEGLSAVLPLLPGDLIFTGTPAGVGLGRSPQRFISPGEELVSRVAGIGEIRQRFVAG
ncbi:MAG: fumarylacetoacetate hydrolase [Pseudonocardia sp. SCN 72-86]|nr:MAG: fumarylacetoacetate hydrolase [Pseudonocardia sp. SCN 72-86]